MLAEELYVPKKRHTVGSFFFFFQAQFISHQNFSGEFRPFIWKVNIEINVSFPIHLLEAGLFCWVIGVSSPFSMFTLRAVLDMVNLSLALVHLSVLFMETLIYVSMQTRSYCFFFS